MVEVKQAIAGRYVVEEPLGRGGMARVYAGTDSVLGRPVAIKVLSDRYARVGSFVARFRREARAAARLNHPGVVSVFDTGSDDSVHYIVMERVDGRTLADLLAGEGRRSPRRAAEIAANVADALAFAHDAGLVHRDVKPGNIMLTGDGSVKVMDFGIARAVDTDTATQTATVLGTAAYLSPEQARGERVDPRSDIYSLGVVLYEMVTGRPPFTGESPLAVALKHVNEEPDPPTRLDPAVPSPLEAIAMRALAKDPGARYQTASQMAADLRRSAGAGLADTEPTRDSGLDSATSTELLPAIAPTEPHPPGAPPRPRPRPWLWVALLPAAALVAGAVLWAALAGDRTNRAGPPAASSPSPQPTSSTPTPTGPASPTSVSDAVARFQALLASGLASGFIDQPAADDLQHRVDEAIGEYTDHGDLEKAIEKLGQAEDRVGELVDKGDIRSSGFAASLHQAISAIEVQMQATPPPSGEGDQGGGDHGKGKGKGHGDGQGNGGD